MLKLQLVIKRCFDIFASSLGLIVLLPLFLIISILIKADSKGPMFFKQERLGRYGKPFQILKFRTMVVNAENIGHGLRVESETDARITKAGRMLRATSLDELPQLINVLRGEMSLVGPRPPVMYHPYDGYVNYPKWAKKRFVMRPGVTGLAQVKVRNSVSWDERIGIDLEYIKYFSLWLDVQILWNTLQRVFSKGDIYGEQDGGSISEEVK